MWNKFMNRLLRNNREWWSKLTDGVLASLVLILLWLLIALAARPIGYLFGNPGLLVFALGLLAVSMFSLQQSLLSRHSEPVRAWYGIAGGFLAWSVVDVLGDMGVPVLPNLAAVVLLIMVSLIIFLLWRNGLPKGARFFALTFLLNWTGLVIISFQETLAKYSPVFMLMFRATGVLALVGAVLILAWLLFQSRHRVQRLNGALAIWFLVSLALYVFSGPLF